MGLGLGINYINVFITIHYKLQPLCYTNLNSCKPPISLTRIPLHLKHYYQQLIYPRLKHNKAKLYTEQYRPKLGFYKIHIIILLMSHAEPFDP